MTTRKMTRYMVNGQKMTKIKLRSEAARLNLSAYPKESWREFAKRVGKALLVEVNADLDKKIAAENKPNPVVFDIPTTIERNQMSLLP